ncbi:hypothetical protein [Synechococcus sp. PCC 7336]|uniref:hypothetical protein n=1 Tax=Synechococcus sp. PCC 7336 TaxID=195250 RepID=UPI0003731B46|nr:hypothetical protein [Synechococcus sp. PCC 7336]
MTVPQLLPELSGEVGELGESQCSFAWLWNATFAPSTCQSRCHSSDRPILDTQLQAYRIQVALSRDTFVAYITGCELQVAREFLGHLPGKLQLDLYEHQAFDLWKRLSRMKMLPVRLERWQSTEKSG